MNFELAALLSQDWLIQPSDFRGLILPMIQRAASATPEDIKAAQASYAARELAPILMGDVAVIPITGPIVYKSSWFSMYFGATAIEDLQMQFRAALADNVVKTIVFRVNSPGGEINMVSEFADEIFAARGQKPMHAVADLGAMSAAYWLSAQADTIHATRSSQLGAIGVFCERLDISAMLADAGIKVEVIAHGANKGTMGNPSQPITDEERAKLQAHVDEIGKWFDSSVARARGVSEKVVLDTFGQGDVFRGEQAIKVGLADKKNTFGQLMSRLTKGRVTATSARAAVSAPGVRPKAAAADDDENGCPTCDDDCPCEQEETCPPECPSCSEDCDCRMTKAKVEEPDKDAAAREIADQHAAIVASRWD